MSNCSWCGLKIEGHPHKLSGFPQFGYHRSCMSDLIKWKAKHDPTSRLKAEGKLQIVEGDRSA